MGNWGSNGKHWHCILMHQKVPINWAYFFKFVFGRVCVCVVWVVSHTVHFDVTGFVFVVFDVIGFVFVVAFVFVVFVFVFIFVFWFVFVFVFVCLGGR